MIGRQLGKFRVEEELGSGGMGVVYRAVDSSLGRSVAIKVLPDDCARSSENRTRFEREARMLAALNHPNIAAIHGFEDFDGICGLVLEYVPGRTLAERLQAGAVPVTEALTIACRLAEALEAAHDRGIVHRDLKPANIKITPQDVVKVLDFGLAKMGGSAAVAAGAIDLAATETLVTARHVIVGTPAYMSPEQAQGKLVDRRTDLWAFGCVFYELLTRKRAFAGDSVSDQLASVIARDPEWKALPGDLDPRASRLLRRCLEKDPHKRLCDAGDARLELEDVLAGVAFETPPKPRSRWFVPGIAVATLVLGAIAGGSWRSVAPANEPPPPVVRFAIDLPPAQRIVPSWNPALLFRPDGSTLAYFTIAGGVVTRERRLDSLQEEILPPGRFSIMGYSPDGKWALLMDSAGRQIKKISLAGGAPTVVMDSDMFNRGDWGADGYLYFTNTYPGGILRMPADGGPHEPVTGLDEQRQEIVHKHAQLLPGGQALIFTATGQGMESYDDARVELQVLGSRTRKVLVDGGFAARYAPSGHIVYARGGSLHAVPFDLRALEVTGPPVKVVDGVLMSTNTGSAYYDVSTTGTLAYAEGTAEGGERSVVWVDRTGREDVLPLPPRSYLFPRISPDQSTLAIEVEGVTHDLYTYDFQRAVMTKITTDGLSHAPVWTPDGAEICYRSWRAGSMTMWRMPVDRSAPSARLATLEGSQSAVAVSPDGRYLSFNQMKPGAPASVYVLPLTGESAPQPAIESNFNAAAAKFSPDGRWITYCSNESGRPEIYIEPWPGPGPRIQISADGGLDPIWSRRGDEIFYRDGERMMFVPIVMAGGPRPGRPKLLWEARYSLGMSSSCGPPGVMSGNYDVTADGQRFLMIRDHHLDVSSSRLIVVLNWVRELLPR
jgi:serine/threonine protein kinase